MSKDLNAVVHDDWDNRDMVDSIGLGIHQMTAFLSRFDAHTRQTLAMLDSKISSIERKLHLVEARTGTITGERLHASSVSASADMLVESTENLTAGVGEVGQ
ncbi:hypothetical protein HK104_001445 [Borealophlyctis nickersoniae]|nr:hypothetical protein HK104_001445 [Borealophlyctis nickersoniae]